MPIITPPAALDNRSASGPAPSRQFECSIDKDGNIYMAAGSVLNPKHGQVFTIADLAISSARPALPNLNGERSFLGPRPVVFLGGNGRNISATTTGGTLVPVGIFRPTVPDTFEGTFANGFSIVFDAGTGDAAITDGTIDVATGSGFTLAPVGTFSSTAAGETAYNGGSPFTITTDTETGGAIPGCLVNATTSLIAADEFTATDTQHFTGATLTGWVLVIAGDGSAVINDGTDDVASRASGLAYDPAGSYISTSYGAATWGDDGEAFTIYVQGLSAFPVEGWVYCQITESAPGEISGVTGPFFGASVPDNAGDNFFVPIAYSDGLGGLQQLHEGSIHWSGGGGGGSGITWVTLTSAEYLALDPPDADTIYDINDVIP